MANAAAPAAAPSGPTVMRTVPATPMPPGASESETRSAFRSLLDTDPSTPNTLPKKPPAARQAPAARSNAPHTGGENADDLSDDDLGELPGAQGNQRQRQAPAEDGHEDADDRQQQRDDDAPPDDQEPDPDAGDPDFNPDGPDPEADDETFLNRRVKVTINGEEKVVPIKELQAGYQRHEDYSRKTNEVAQTRQQLQGGLEAIAHQQSALDQLLLHLANEVSSAMPQRPSSEQWDLLARDHPNDYQRLKAAWDRHDQRQGEIQNLRVANMQKANEQNALRMQHFTVAEAQRLFKIAPHFAGESGKQIKTALVKYAQNIGIPPEELAQVNKAEHLVVLWKAMRYDEAVERAAGRRAGTRVTRETPRAAPVTRERPEPQTPAKPRSAAPGSAGSSTRKVPTKLQAAQTRLRRTGDVRDAAAAIAELL